MSSILHSSPSPSPRKLNFFDDDNTDDGDTASQHSISLSSRPTTPPISEEQSGVKKEHFLEKVDVSKTPLASEAFKLASFRRDSDRWSRPLSPNSYLLNQNISTYSPSNESGQSSVIYPPPPLRLDTEVASMASVSSSSSKKARPESMLLELPKGPIVPGIALVDFNHLVSVVLCVFDILCCGSVLTVMMRFMAVY